MFQSSRTESPKVMQVGDAKTVTIVGRGVKRSDMISAEERGTNGLDSASRESI